jgi:FixJ family two-component response regulator
MDAQAPIVFLVDDEPTVVKALARLLSASGFEIRSFQSSRSFLDQHDTGVPGCIVLDMAMPELTGLDLLSKLKSDTQPIIFISGKSDIRTSVTAMKNGAMDFLTKPVDEKKLLAAIDAALERDRAARIARAQMESIRERLATLTRREREIFDRVVRGRQNKNTAADLGISIKTIKVHRARMMRKMKTRTVAELVHLVGLVGLPCPHAEAF